MSDDIVIEIISNEMIFSMFSQFETEQKSNDRLLTRARTNHVSKCCHRLRIRN